MAPKEFDLADQTAAHHWRKNHDVAVRALSEDFATDESIQSDLQSGADEALPFGRREDAPDRFNRTLDQALSGQSA